jgi:hypothetical protein
MKTTAYVEVWMTSQIGKTWENMGKLDLLDGEKNPPNCLKIPKEKHWGYWTY